MKFLLFVLLITTFIACDKDDDDNNPSEYPKHYTFNRVDQTDEGLYLVTSTTALTDLPTNIGLYGAYKDSLKTELQNQLESTLDLQEIEVVSDSELKFHYIYQGYSAATPVTYSIVNGEIVFTDTIFNGLVSHDKANDQFLLCGVTPFALPGLNAVNPFGAPYLQFTVQECVPGRINRDYALEFLDRKDLQPLDTIGVLVTKYIYKQ
jgi:hypothetical protein